jgi:hypothetical protein
MVYLKDLKSQWPWSASTNAKDLSDKEIYTHRVSFEDASDTWRVPVFEPMNGFAYTGLRVSVLGKTEEYTVVPRLVLGQTNKPMFELPWDQTIANNGSWAPLGFPLTHKMIAITEDGLDYVIKHTESCWGQVEFVAQRFEDILEDEGSITYLFLNHRTDKVEWILNKDNRMYKPDLKSDPVYRQPAKLIPSVLRLLDETRTEWPDVATSWAGVNLPVPLL